jgi:hypothetical protein
MGSVPLKTPNPAQKVSEIPVCKRQNDPRKKAGCNDVEKMPISSGAPNDSTKVREKKGDRYDGKETGSQRNPDFCPGRNMLH